MAFQCLLIICLIFCALSLNCVLNIILFECVLVVGVKVLRPLENLMSLITFIISFVLYPLCFILWIKSSFIFSKFCLLSFQT